MTYLPKNARVRIDSGLVAKPIGTYSMAGAQMKVVVERHVFTGTVRHLRGDRPIDPTVVKLYIEPDSVVSLPFVRPYGCTCEGHDRLVECNQDWVVVVLDV